MVKILGISPLRNLTTLSITFALFTFIVSIIGVVIYASYSELRGDKSWEGLSTIRKLGRTIALIFRVLKLIHHPKHETVSMKRL